LLTRYELLWNTTAQSQDVPKFLAVYHGS